MLPLGRSQGGSGLRGSRYVHGHAEQLSAFRVRRIPGASTRGSDASHGPELPRQRLAAQCTVKYQRARALARSIRVSVADRKRFMALAPGEPACRKAAHHAYA
jgi:hypothetical protein